MRRSWGRPGGEQHLWHDCRKRCCLCSSMLPVLPYAAFLPLAGQPAAAADLSVPVALTGRRRARRPTARAARKHASVCVCTHRATRHTHRLRTTRPWPHTLTHHPLRLPCQVGIRLSMFGGFQNATDDHPVGTASAAVRGERPAVSAGVAAPPCCCLMSVAPFDTLLNAFDAFICPSLAAVCPGQLPAGGAQQASIQNRAGRRMRQLATLGQPERCHCSVA